MNKYLKQSLAMHTAVFLIMIIDLPNFWRHDLTLGATPIIVDLSQVRIDELTNLPAKAEFGPEDRKATVEEHKEEPKYTQNSAPEPEPETEQTEPEEQPEEQPEQIKEDFLEEPTPVPDKKPEKKPDPKPKPKAPPRPSSKPQPKPKPKPKPDNDDTKQKTQPQNNVRSNALKSLLQEIDNDNKNLEVAERTQKAMIKEGTPVQHMGIEGGNSTGSYFSDLTISETDYIANVLRNNWNLDPGAIGIEGMLVEIRVSLAKDGTIQKVDVIDSRRFNSDPSFRSVAESAIRAIYATQKPFKEFFGVKYADKYNTWSTLRLRFDPLNKGVR